MLYLYTLHAHGVYLYQNGIRKSVGVEESKHSITPNHILNNVYIYEYTYMSIYIYEYTTYTYMLEQQNKLSEQLVRQRYNLHLWTAVDE